MNRNVKKRQLSVVSLLVFTAAFAVLLAGTREFGAYGFVFGIFILAISIGCSFDRRALVLGGTSGALILCCTLLSLWLTHGTLDKMDRPTRTQANYLFEMMANEAAEFHTKHGRYPDAMPDYPPDFLYQSDDGKSYTVTFLGADRRSGGTGRNADFNSNEMDAHFQRRLGFREFLSDYPGSSGLVMALLVSIVCAASVSISVNSEKDTDHNLRLASVIVFAIGATITGYLMGMFHIAAGQSGH